MSDLYREIDNQLVANPKIRYASDPYPVFIDNHGVAVQTIDYHVAPLRGVTRPSDLDAVMYSLTPETAWHEMDGSWATFCNFGYGFQSITEHFDDITAADVNAMKAKINPNCRVPASFPLERHHQMWVYPNGECLDQVLNNPNEVYYATHDLSILGLSPLTHRLLIRPITDPIINLAFRARFELRSRVAALSSSR